MALVGREMVVGGRRGNEMKGNERKAYAGSEHTHIPFHPISMSLRRIGISGTCKELEERHAHSLSLSPPLDT